VILVLGTIRIPPAKIDAARTAMANMIEASRREDGCVAYSYSLDILDDGLIHVVEKWRDRQSLETHFHTDHLREWRQQFTRLGITDRNLRLFEVDQGTPT
jgi:quinol monooxygenase YgiN